MRLKSVHFADTPNLTNVFTCFMSPFLQMLLRFLKKVLEFSMINEFWTTRTSHPGECEMKLPRIWNEMWIHMEKLKLIKCQDCSNRFSPNLVQNSCKYQLRLLCLLWNEISLENKKICSTCGTSFYVVNSRTSKPSKGCQILVVLLVSISQKTKIRSSFS